MHQPNASYGSAWQALDGIVVSLHADKNVEVRLTMLARLKDMPPRRKADLLEYAFERYYRKTALMGARASTAKMVEAVARAGVDEIACLIDFGLSSKTIMEGLEWLDDLRKGK